MVFAVVGDEGFAGSQLPASAWKLAKLPLVGNTSLLSTSRSPFRSAQG